MMRFAGAVVGLGLMLGACAATGPFEPTTLADLPPDQARRAIELLQDERFGHCSMQFAQLSACEDAVISERNVEGGSFCLGLAQSRTSTTEFPVLVRAWLHEQLGTVCAGDREPL